jgi:hypothetical protein
MQNIFTHTLRFSSMFSLAIAVALAGIGCAPAAPDSTFVAGTEGVLGFLVDPIGTTFTIGAEGEGECISEVDVAGAVGDSSFTFDETGNLTSITAVNGSVLTLEHADDGSIVVTVTDASFEAPFVGDIPLGDMTFAVPAGTITATPTVDCTQDTCAVIDATCDYTNALIQEVRPAVLAAVDDLDIPQDMLDLLSLVGGIEGVVETLIDQYLQQIEDYCSAWDSIKASSASPCS